MVKIYQFIMQLLNCVKINGSVNYVLSLIFDAVMSGTRYKRLSPFK